MYGLFYVTLTLSVNRHSFVNVSISLSSTIDVIAHPEASLLIHSNSSSFSSLDIN